MTLGAHLRELRNRIVVAALALVLAAIPGWIVYDTLIAALAAPMKRRGAAAELNFANLTDPFVVHLQVALFVAVILSSPVWLWEIWAFVVPGLRKNEKRIAEILSRYEDGHPVHEAVENSRSSLIASSRRAKAALGLSEDWPVCC